MDEQKRTVIVREIEHWRRSKLLPDHYCDFLLNLYRDADAAENPEAKVRKRAVTESNPLHWIIAFGMAACICYLILYFSSFHPLLQIVIFIALVLACLGTSAFFRERRPLLSYLLFGLGAGALIVGGLLLLQENGMEHWGTLTFYMACCGIIWVAFGIALQVPWIHFCGWVVLLLVYAVLVNRLLQPENWVFLQLTWLPLSMLFGWVGWLLGRRAKASGAVFLIMACLLWLTPEMYAFLLTDWSILTMQWFILGKLLLLGVVGFALRKTWIEWVV